jgi:hypothetical protein
LYPTGASGVPAQAGATGLAIIPVMRTAKSFNGGRPGVFLARPGNKRAVANLRQVPDFNDIFSIEM